MRLHWSLSHQYKAPSKYAQQSVAKVLRCNAIHVWWTWREYSFIKEQDKSIRQSMRDPKSKDRFAKPGSTSKCDFDFRKRTDLDYTGVRGRPKFNNYRNWIFNGIFVIDQPVNTSIERTDIGKSGSVYARYLLTRHIECINARSHHRTRGKTHSNTKSYHA